MASLVTFFRELYSRRVWLVGGAYLAVFWLLIQLAAIIEEPLSLPPWFDTAVIVALALGLPVALVLAWAQETSTAASTAPAPMGPAAQSEPLADVTKPVPGFGGRPAIAVLPFENLSGDPEQAYFSDGLTEDIITGLQAFKNFPVLARNSTFIYKGRAVDVREVARELGAGYVVEGSVRRAGDRVRITAQLIDKAGVHVWAERYDRRLEDIFALQDEITAEIIAAIAPEVEGREIRRAREGAPESLDAWELYLRARELLLTMNPHRQREALALLDKSVALDPTFAGSHVELSKLHFVNAVPFRGLITKDTQAESLRKAWEYASRVVEHNPTDARARASYAWCLAGLGEYEQALCEAGEAVRLNPSEFDARIARSAILTWTGRCEEALAEMNVARRLSPRERPWQIATWTGMANFAMGRYDDALRHFGDVLRARPQHNGVHMLRIGALDALGRYEEAKAAYREMQAALPVEGKRELPRLPFENEAISRSILDALRRAGWQG